MTNRTETRPAQFSLRHAAQDWTTWSLHFGRFLLRPLYQTKYSPLQQSSIFLCSRTNAFCSVPGIVCIKWHVARNSRQGATDRYGPLQLNMFTKALFTFTPKSFSAPSIISGDNLAMSVCRSNSLLQKSLNNFKSLQILYVQKASRPEQLSTMSRKFYIY